MFSLVHSVTYPLAHLVEMNQQLRLHHFQIPFDTFLQLLRFLNLVGLLSLWKTTASPAFPTVIKSRLLEVVRDQYEFLSIFVDSSSSSRFPIYPCSVPTLHFLQDCLSYWVWATGLDKGASKISLTYYTIHKDVFLMKTSAGLLQLHSTCLSSFTPGR